MGKQAGLYKPTERSEWGVRRARIGAYLVVSFLILNFFLLLAIVQFFG
jgi:hypothetical protein